MPCFFLLPVGQHCSDLCWPVGLMRRKADHELVAYPNKYFSACGAVGFAPGGPRPCDRRIEQEASAEAACHVHLRARPETHEG